jgi:aminoglycoside/choline kinase family phosphotransferase
MDHIPNEAQLDACMDLVIASATSQPQVFMHRDFHSANLMVLPDDNVAVLDFQDAFLGPVTYDLVSLLRDCYIAWPNDRVTGWVNAYREMLIETGAISPVDQETFMRWFDLMGVQRHLKALMTFARKQVRDLQPRYLRHIPRTLCYLLNATEKYPELAALNTFLESAREKTDKCVA